jgi:hypothetical protein
MSVGGPQTWVLARGFLQEGNRLVERSLFQSACAEDQGTLGVVSLGRSSHVE